eukprot:jgi/Picsp_1/3508/NSC_06346-R1_---NA---
MTILDQKMKSPLDLPGLLGSGSVNLKKDMSTLSKIAKRRAKREQEQEKTSIKLEKIKAELLASVPVRDDSIEKHKKDLENHASANFGSLEKLEKSENFLDAVQVIVPLESIVAPVIDLEGTDLGMQINQALGCMHASLGYTEAQRVRLILNQYIVSGAALCRLKVTKTCSSKLIATLLSVMGLDEDIKVASAAHNMLRKIWELAVPSDGQKQGEAIVLEDVPAFSIFTSLLKDNGCEMQAFKPSKGQHNNEADQCKSRIHFINLIICALGEFCDLVAKQGLSIAAPQGKDILDLAKMILCIRFDPMAYRMQENLDRALLSLFKMVDDATWKMLVVDLSYSLALSFGIGASKGLKYRIVKELPCGLRVMDSRTSHDRVRCLELQQCTASLLIDIGMEAVDSERKPKKLNAANIPIDPADILKQQAWIKSPSMLTECPDGENSINHFIRVEILLKLCDLLLWPYILSSTRSSSKIFLGKIDPSVLREWSSCMYYVQRKIRTLNPEDQAVKVLANYLKLQYDEYLVSQEDSS